MLAAVTDQEFEDKVLKASNPVLVDFWAPWCGPCKALTPIVEEIASQYEGKVDVYKLNIDENAQATTNYKIKGVPTLMLFKDGEVVDQLVGAQPKATIETLIDGSAS